MSSFQNQLKFRARQMVEISRSSLYQQLSHELSNMVSFCKHEGIRINTLLNEGAPVGKELHQRIQKFLSCSTNCIVRVKKEIPEERCEVEGILPYLKFENQIIMQYADELLKESIVI